MADNQGNSQDNAANQLCALIEYIATRLVDDPDVVEVEADTRGANVRVHLYVPDAEMGKVIGREGRIARAMRTLLMIAASRRGLRSSLDIGS